jgi:hypothetical protein
MKHIKTINEDRFGEFEPPKRISNQPTRILLTEDDFKALVSGGIVKKEDILIALQDIGYNTMIDIINEQE